jgi:hypothetical protein
MPLNKALKFGFDRSGDFRKAAVFFGKLIMAGSP